jgi:hypothetical protein
MRAKVFLKDSGIETADIRFVVLDNCNASTRLGFAYTNDTGLDAEVVVTGWRRFKV